ncbi:hypothetical protein POM88_051340 [Heracleum sosnowskyi]|uniref:F-box domain-containing protein n=1 Tax=Heracleum sosnowskyi TaxID=360622 RepID=A0AAD8M3B3_9APIA|nr:hypothetical protein POM88_051340 [Heracleum sosnowskyi]
MIPDAKRKRVDVCIEDRISDLPTHLIDDILDRMPVRDGARTSILSKTWKNIWETHPNIHLRGQFIEQFMSSMKDAKAQYLRVVNSNLLAHVGPVKTFSLRIPAPLNLGDTPYPCLWIKQLPEKRVKLLDLRNRRPNHTINMPSYFFSCSDLNWLYLDNWKLLNPPHKFRGFPNLAKITLCFVAFTTKMSFGTQVQHFELRCCTGIEHLDIQLTDHGKNIKYLNLERSLNMEMRRGLDYHPFTDIKKSFNLRRLLGNMSSIRTLQVDFIGLWFLDPGLTFHRHLTSTMENLTTLILYNVALNDMYLISNALCLLRSMPILKLLEIKVDWCINVQLKSEQYLESPDCADVTLNQLREVSMRNILGSRAELLLIKLLLASSPSLRRMELKYNTKVDDSREFVRIKEELLQFPRKSPEVQISWRRTYLRTWEAMSNSGSPPPKLMCMTEPTELSTLGLSSSDKCRNSESLADMPNELEARECA